ncbi:MAG TPA: malate synthase A [Gemmatimonadales bacterium]
MSGLQIRAPDLAEARQIITAESLQFLELLARHFGPRRKALLQRRKEIRDCLRSGALPDFLPETRDVRERSWTVAPAPGDLDDRRVEITGPVERKMMINALNSGAKVFMADFEDALSPPWENVIAGQVNCTQAVRRRLEYLSPEGKRYELAEQLATLVVRPRGWHLEEKHAVVDGEPMSASLFDFGLYFFHNAQELLARGSGPYFYLPKLENHLEARLWNEVFDLAQDALGIPRGTVRATVLIETVLAAYEMDEILYELRDHAAGLNAGRWDYLFSIIKNFRDRPEFLLPDRSQLTMTVPFMQAYTELLVKTCHRRGAHAIGGMAAFIPSRRDAEINKTALARVREDKTREVRAGYDGAWVAHPDLVPVVAEVFGSVLGNQPHQKERQRDDVVIRRDQLLDVRVPGGRITDAGLRNNIGVGLQYLAAWLGGSGAVAINHLMEDAATAEIARSQLWQWIRHRAKTESGEPITLERCRRILGEEQARLEQEGSDRARLGTAAQLLDSMFSAEEFPEFLTLAAYQKLV